MRIHTNAALTFSKCHDLKKKKYPVNFVISHNSYLLSISHAEREGLLRKIQSIAVKDKQENRDPEWLSQWTGPA